MSVPSNILQNVQTFQKAELAYLQNAFAAISLANKKFAGFNDLTANLGDTVTFDLAPRFVTVNGLVITQQPSAQRPQPLVCSQAANTSAGYTDQQFIFNTRDYMERFGMSAMMELGTQVEEDVLRNITTSVRINDPQNASFNQIQTSSGPFRFFGNGITPINSFGQLAQMIANFKDFGAAPRSLRGLLPMTVVPGIVNTGLQQFALKRNDEIANSWELGPFAGCEWYESNLLPIHTAGSIGDAGTPNNVLTLVSTNDPTGTNVTSITWTEPTAGTDADAIQVGDLVQFNDGVSGQPNLRFLTFIGHKVSAQPVQFVCTARSASVAGSVTTTLRTATGIGLVWAAGANRNLNFALAAGMQATVVPSHRAGLLWSGDQYYLAMPKLPDESPYTTVMTTDPESGVSLRHYFGSQFGQNNRAYVRDVIWGSVLVPENCLRIVFPL